MKKNKKSCTDNKKIFLYQYKSINDYTIDVTFFQNFSLS